MDRRSFIKTLSATTCTIALPAFATSGKPQRPIKIFLISGWQDVNIGDIAHTPGMINVLQKYIPNAQISVWKLRNTNKEAAELFARHFPNVKVFKSDIDSNGLPYNKELMEEIKSSDVCVHGSGPSVVGRKQLAVWRKLTKKPYGIFGTTIEHPTEEVLDLVRNASFVYTRETKSVKILRDKGITIPELKFAPDATFDMGIKDDDKALAFMKERGLKEKEFIVVVPRLRRTPYWEIRPESRTTSYTEEKIKAITELNNSKKEVDHAKAREAIIRWVRETKKPVLICPEMTYEVDIMDELLINPLPEDVKPFVQKRGYWMPDEAASLYARATCVLSFECHTPIMALDCGTPSFYLRQPEDTIKGHMYYDLGFDEWVFEIEETTGKQIADGLMEVYADYPKALKYAKAGIDRADKLFESGAKFVEKVALENMDTK